MITLSKQQLSKAFKTFNDKVYKGEYKKIPYDIWKNLDYLVGGIDVPFDCVDINITTLSTDDTLEVTFETKGKNCFGFGFTAKEKDIRNFLTELYHIYYTEVAIIYCNDNKAIEAIEERKNNMSNSIFGNFDFGVVDSNSIKLSPYGLAIKDASGSWVSYDRNDNKIVNVDILNFNFENMLYKMPVAIKDVAVGDIVIHARKPLYVTEVLEGKVIGIDPYAGEEKTILFAHSPFGFDFVTKVVNLMDGIFNAETATADSPFGSYLPLMVMGSNGGNIDMNAILPFMLMGNGNVDNKMLMFMAMSNGGQNNNLLPLLFMMNKESR